MYFSECIQTALNNWPIIPESFLFAQQPHPQPSPLALNSAAAAVSQVDLLCVTPLNNYMTLCPKKLTRTLYVVSHCMRSSSNKTFPLCIQTYLFLTAVSKQSQ